MEGTAPQPDNQFVDFGNFSHDYGTLCSDVADSKSFTGRFVICLTHLPSLIGSSLSHGQFRTALKVIALIPTILFWPESLKPDAFIKKPLIQRNVVLIPAKNYNVDTPSRLRMKILREALISEAIFYNLNLNFTIQEEASDQDNDSSDSITFTVIPSQRSSRPGVKGDDIIELSHTGALYSMCPNPFFVQIKDNSTVVRDEPIREGR